MSILSVWNGYADFKVIDDATRAEIAGFTWVDDVRLEYEAYVLPARYGCNGGLATEIVKVSAVSVNHAAREIHVNTPQPIMLTVTVGAPVRAVRACDRMPPRGNLSAHRLLRGLSVWVRPRRKAMSYIDVIAAWIILVMLLVAVAEFIVDCIFRIGDDE
jgi:hypothetical protein